MRASLQAIFRRDLALAVRQSSDSLMGVIFFLISLSLFPLGVGASPDILARIGAGVIWVLALLAVLLTLERLFTNDYDDGSLDQLMLAPAPLEAITLVKCLAHWLSSGLLLVLVSPLLAILMSLPADALWALPLALLLGTPTLTLIGAVGAALLVGSRRGGVMIALLVLPLYIPVLIFGVSAVDGVLLGLSAKAPFLILGAMFLTALALTPWACSAALRLASE